MKLRRNVRPSTAALVLALAIAPLARAHADEGMWLFNRAPKKQIKEKHGFDLTDAWLEHVQKSAVRFSTGGSGSIVSANGLVMTNHHVGRDLLHKMSDAKHDYLETGFYAETADKEVPCPDLEVNVLWSMEDVTDRVEGAVEPDMNPAQAGDARRKTINEIEKQSKETTGLKSQVVTLYQGGRYHLYRYKNFQDVRLVMAPEESIAFFGGDPDNFEYPRYDLDMCFFRLYEDGKPFKAEHYLKWSKNGTTDNELVFVAGHPGSTQRLYTKDHLEYLRDFGLPLTMRSIWRREVQLATFMGRSAENERIAKDDFFGIQNTRKSFTGRVAAIQDPLFVDKKFRAEDELRAAVMANPEWKQKWGDAWDLVAQARKAQREFAVRYGALGGAGLGLGGTLFGKARDVVRLTAEKEKPSAERLREYGEANQETLMQQLYSPAPIYVDFEVEKLASSLAQMVELLGGEDPTVVAVLAGKGPQARAEECVRGTKLGDVAERKRLVEGGRKAVDASQDPMIQLVRQLDAESRSLRKRFDDEVDAPEKKGYAKIAAATFAKNGEDVYPDATFTLRLSYGVVKGFEENGRQVPPYTNFAGLYERADERGNKYPFELPARWAKSKDVVNLNTPYDFVSTCDIVGGNSGSPVVNKAGEVVGLIFDGNIQSLAFAYAYDDRQARCVSVDTRAIIEALRKVYGCTALANEITGAKQN